MASVDTITSNQRTIEQIIKEGEAKKTSTRNTGELGKDDFLQLLITQLQHQDPMSPSSDQEFIAQIAQFSSLEQMQNLNQSFSMQTGFAMMGKYVQAEVTDESGNVSYVNGQVSAVRKSGSDVVAIVNDTEVPLDKIFNVSDTAEGAGGQKDINIFSQLIGLMSKFSMLDETDKKTTIEGIISSLENTEKGMMATVDEVVITPTLNKGAFASIEEYLEYTKGQEATFTVKDKQTGAIVEVTGKLRSWETAANGEISVVLDGVQANVDNIVATRKVDLFNSEQLLLAEILKVLREQAGLADEETVPDTTTDTATESITP